MRATIVPVSVAILCAMLIPIGCAKKQFTNWKSFQNPVVSAQVKSFVAEKEAQAGAAARANGGEMPAAFKRFFAAAAQGDWLAVSNDFQNFRKRAPQYEHTGKTDLQLRGIAWQAVIEVWGAFDAMAGNEKYATLYANEIIGSIPPGSIYFGGTDPGRFLITGMEKSQANADPFFLLTQNALADNTYLDYVRSMYGNQLYIPTAGDSEKCFRDYTADAEKRSQNHHLKPGENVQVDPKSGRVAISGQIAVMEINGLLAKIIFDQNSNREFYIEQSFPLDWMYPYLEPHNLIFKLDRHPLAELPQAVVQQDHDYWENLVQPMIGDWLNDDTSVRDIADFAGKIYGRHDFTGFSGDPQFVRSDYSCKMFSKERASIAGLYAWRAQRATDAGEKQRMNAAADLAFRQAWALCPYSSEATLQYVNFLTGEKRSSDALLLAQSAVNLPEADKSARGWMRDLITRLQTLKQ